MSEKDAAALFDELIEITAAERTTHAEKNELIVARIAAFRATAYAEGRAAGRGEAIAEAVALVSRKLDPEEYDLLWNNEQEYVPLVPAEIYALIAELARLAPASKEQP